MKEETDITRDGGMHGPEIVRTLGVYLGTFHIYGVKHTITLEALKSCYQIIVKRLEAVEAMAFSFTGDRLLIEGKEVEVKSPVMQRFLNQVASLSLSGFTIQRGMSMEEFADLLAIIGSRPESIQATGGFAQTMAQRGMAHVCAKTVTYQAVTDEEIVVSKDGGGGKGDGDGSGGGDGKGDGGGKGDGDGGGGGDGKGDGDGKGGGDGSAIPEKELQAYLENQSGSAEAATRALRAAVTDLPKLAHIILQAAQSGGVVTASGQPAPSLPQGIIECLQRAYAGMRSEPSARTPSGKKALVRTLQLLRQAIETELAKSGDDPNAKLDEAIDTAFEEMTDGLQMDALAVEYVKKRMLSDKSERSLLKFIRSTGGEAGALEELRERLSDAGLPAEKWESLLALSQRQGMLPAPAAIAGVPLPSALNIGPFAGLIARLNERLSALDKLGDRASTESLHEIMENLDRELVNLVARVESKIHSLSLTEEEKIAEANPKTEEERKYSAERRRRMGLIAEIAQEFCQPLSVVDSSIDMIRKCRAGGITEQQGALLSLAARNGERLNKLIGELMQICGMPATLKPDRWEQPAPAEAPGAAGEHKPPA